MKILQVVSSLTAGGAEGFVTSLSVSLAELDADVRVFVMAGARGERGQMLLARLREAGVEISGAEERKPRSLKNLIQLTRLIRSWQPDIVHAHLYASEVACVCARVLSLGSHARYVRTLHNTDICNYRSPRMIRTLGRFFGQTIACSPSVADAYRDFMGKQQIAELVTIPNGTGMPDVVPGAEEKRHSRNAFGIPEETFVVTHIGRMSGAAIGTGLDSGQKAQDVLLEAFSRAFRGDSKAVLVLVGDGPLRPEAEALARNLEIEHQVRFLGQQPEPWPALKAADMFCFPSRHEGLPLVLPEAGSCGLPVAASDIPEISSLYPGEAWLLKPVNDESSCRFGIVSSHGTRGSGRVSGTILHDHLCRQVFASLSYNMQFKHEHYSRAHATTSIASCGKSFRDRYPLNRLHWQKHLLTV